MLAFDGSPPITASGMSLLQLRGRCAKSLQRIAVNRFELIDSMKNNGARSCAQPLVIHPGCLLPPAKTFSLYYVC